MSCPIHLKVYKAAITLRHLHQISNEMELGLFGPWVPLGTEGNHQWVEVQIGVAWLQLRNVWNSPLVNTSCFSGPHTLISPCPSPPLIIIMASYSLPTPPLLPDALPVALVWCLQVYLPLLPGICLLEAPHPIHSKADLFWYSNIKYSF